jgi:nicotinate-nucleotide pyrophosphorylase (carboxylating)
MEPDVPQSLPWDDALSTLIELAVREDMGAAGAGTAALDRTVALTIPSNLRATGHIVARKPGIICGTALLPEILAHYHGDLRCEIFLPDGHAAVRGAVVARIAGPAGALLSAERVLLNFLTRLSGVATLTHAYVQAAANSASPGKPVVCDTRKTTPGWRMLEKYAVRCGGGVNHRMGLYDGVMLKDNHLAALRRRYGSTASLADLTRNVRAQLPANITLWLEVDTLEQLKNALPGAADIILLDNMPPDQLCQAVRFRDEFKAGGPPLLEASGGVTLDTIAAIAAAGVDRISVGAITHSAPGLDLAMDFIENE